MFTGGAEPTVPAVRLDDTPIHLHAQHPIRADIAYDGTALTLTLTDTTLSDHAWTHTFAVDIPAAVGGPTAYAGFTAGTGELSARQAIESWTLADRGLYDRAAFCSIGARADCTSSRSAAQSPQGAARGACRCRPEGNSSPASPSPS